MALTFKILSDLDGHNCQVRLTKLMWIWGTRTGHYNSSDKVLAEQKWEITTKPIDDEIKIIR